MTWWLWPVCLAGWLLAAYCTAYMIAAGWNHGLYASADSINKRRRAERDKNRPTDVFKFKPKGDYE